MEGVGLFPLKISKKLWENPLRNVTFGGISPFLYPFIFDSKVFTYVNTKNKAFWAFFRLIQNQKVKIQIKWSK